LPVTVTPGAVSAIDVPLIEWPAAEDLRSRLAAEGRPRLLVVPPSAPPPSCADELEDWVRQPVDMADVMARTATLRRRAELQTRRPVLDDHGLLWLHGRWVSIPPTQLSVIGLLVERTGHVVASADLRTAYGEAGGSVDAVALKAAMARLARRLAPLGLHLHNIAGRGSLLEVTEAAR
jgi:hypothetical protein